ncbi:MAG: hypothetical protein U9R69_00380 [Thermodesulfobacteriota bacterium]|nr:hypothetical protein [Thermodesulfobacteriota bacterium]
MLYQTHNPLQLAFNFYCNRIDATEHQIIEGVERLRDTVKGIRKGYNKPIGKNFPYGEESFQNGYLLAYFPYYIEPIYHVLKSANLPDDLFDKEGLKVGFFGGGPCPEALGLAAYLREKAPHLRSVAISIYDREMSWKAVQQGLLPQMLPHYAAKKTDYIIQDRKCDITTCNFAKCKHSSSITGTDLIIAQNFLAEVQGDCNKAIDTFEGIIRRSNCRYAVFVENNYNENKNLMAVLSRRLVSKGFSTKVANVTFKEIRPNFALPKVLQNHLFTGESGLMAKRNVKFHSMVIEIERQ